MTRLLRSGPRRELALAVLLSAATVAAGIGLMGTSGWLIARAAQHPEASALTLAAVGVRSLGLGRGVLRYAERLVGHDAVLRWMADLRVVVFRCLAAQPSGWRTADALGALGRDVEGLQDLWLRGLVPCAATVTVATAAVVGTSLVLPVAGALLAAGLAVAVLGLPALAWWLAARADDPTTLRAAHLQAVTDLLQGSADLVVHGGVSAALRQADAATDALSGQATSVARRGAAIQAVDLLLQGLTTVGVCWAAASAVADGRLAPVWAVVLGLVALAAFEPVTGAADAVVAVRDGRAALRRLDALEQSTLTERVDPAPAAPLLAARGAGLSRDGRGRPAVAGVDLDLVRGRSVAVLGGSGAGKSTLLALLAGQLVPTCGAVECAGVPAWQLTQAERPGTCVLVEQDAHVFDTSLRDNLRIARPDAADEDLVRVLAAVGLEPWLQALPEGLATQVAHGGARLSGGQRRRLAVARGLLSRAPVLLLDEPTEGLAPDEADALLDAVLACSRHRAVVVVTHRLSVLERVDEVLLLDRGRVVVHGTPEQVRQHPGLVRDAAQVLAAERLLAG